jgi:hypothetical protein
MRYAPIALLLLLTACAGTPGTTAVPQAAAPTTRHAPASLSASVCAALDQQVISLQVWSGLTATDLTAIQTDSQKRYATAEEHLIQFATLADQIVATAYKYDGISTAAVGSGQSDEPFLVSSLGTLNALVSSTSGDLKDAEAWKLTVQELTAVQERMQEAYTNRNAAYQQACPTPSTRR